MKRRILRISTVAIMLVMLIVSMLQVNAAGSYLLVDGFEFLPTSETSATIYGYDESSNDVVIPRKFLSSYNVSEIADYAFMNNNSMTNISFSEAKFLRKLGKSSFAYCTQLNNVILPAWLNEISNSTFQGCTSLSSITIYGNLTAIPKQTFYNCTSLNNVVIPATVTNIENLAFGACTSLSEITIPKNTTSIAENAFVSCDNLTMKVYRDSYAHAYAKEHNIDFELLDPYEIGDVDMNGVVTISDATEIQRGLAQIISLTDEQTVLADVNGDGIVNITDATDVQRRIAGFI